jgi:two-component system chemotaxis response regulator CheB
MSIRVLIVDDSKFICNRIQEILKQESDFLVVGIALNGQQAVQMAKKLMPDVITMDVEMPVMDGISAVKKIMIENPTPILMFSAATHSGAQATLDALNAGAIDFLPKNLDEIDGDREMAKRLLRRRVRGVAQQTKAVRSKSISVKQLGNYSKKQARASIGSFSARKKIELLVIVASTGGPVAIQKILPKLSSNCSFPILIIQHMPQNFTESFAQRLNQLCDVTVKEASDGDILKSGEVLLAPGGMQIEVKAGKKRVAIRGKKEGEIYSPSADITLSSISNLNMNNVLTVVLTGMGSDGKEGAKKLKQKGFSIWAQDEESSTIYGMPKAIVDAKLADYTLSLDEIAAQFGRLS